MAGSGCKLHSFHLPFPSMTAKELCNHILCWSSFRNVNAFSVISTPPLYSLITTTVFVTIPLLIKYFLKIFLFFYKRENICCEIFSLTYLKSCFYPTEILLHFHFIHFQFPHAHEQTTN
jgi:hypothetical protein